MPRYGLLCAVIAASMAFTLVRQLVGHGGYLVDLEAFYCGGWSVLHHADPYTTVPTACMHAIDPGAVALRAPHPPFALAAYALMALVPFKVVGIAFIVLAWLAVGATAAVLSKLTSIESWLVALAIAPLLGYFSISLGQPQPFVALCIVLCAYFLAKENFVAAAIFGVLTSDFPQFGLPVMAALYVCVPKTRIALIAGVAILGIVGLLALGLPANVHFVTVALKLGQMQTAGDSLQYGSSWLLQQFGTTPGPAALFGTLWYLAVTVAGIVYLRWARPSVPIALVALLPAALVTLSSSYVHPQHFALALPFALFALSASKRHTMPLLLGTAVLIVPWMFCIIAKSVPHDLTRVAIFFFLGIAFAACFVRLHVAGKRRPVSSLNKADVAWLAALCVLYATIALVIHVMLGTIATVDIPPNTLATLSFKLPTILALLVILGYGLAVSTRKREALPHAPREQKITASN